MRSESAPKGRKSGRGGAALLALLLLTATTDAGAGLPIGSPAPALVAVALDGTPLDLASYRGRVVILNFWATWCPPCRAEMPALDTFYRTHRDLGVVVIGVSTDRRRDLADVRQVMAAFSYPATLLSSARSSGWPAPNALPMTYILGADGRIAAILAPGAAPVTGTSLEAAIAPLLPTPAAAP